MFSFWKVALQHLQKNVVGTITCKKKAVMAAFFKYDGKFELNREKLKSL